jgi:hypothetical protein
LLVLPLLSLIDSYLATGRRTDQPIDSAPFGPAYKRAVTKPSPAVIT